MLYKIEQLTCAYKEGAVVLSVPYLQIDPGQVLFILGKSGYGKSTLLETLALMNHTIRDGKVIFTPPSSDKKVSFDLHDIWQNKDPELIAGIRSAYFSFIFQQTNLMPNFSVYENIYISRLIQGCPENRCLQETFDIIDRIGLSGIESDRKVTELSGGQRQRVAFARAIISSFDVLFGDEPTGNLDEANARELLGILVDHIHKPNNKPPKTAIIVTHNIDLAVSYADAIVTIVREKGRDFGMIDQESVCQKIKSSGQNNWTYRNSSYSQKEMKELLRKQFENNNVY